MMRNNIFCVIRVCADLHVKQHSNGLREEYTISLLLLFCCFALGKKEQLHSSPQLLRFFAKTHAAPNATTH